MMQSSAGSELETEYVYVLKLEEGKFYVGKSKDVHERLRAHRKGAQEWAWTAKYKPVPGDDAILYRGVVQHNTHEDAVTKEMMSKYGIENVRGGTYSQVKLPEHQERTLKDEKCTWEDLCFVCMEKGHMSRFCPNIPRHRRAFRHAFETSPESVLKSAPEICILVVKRNDEFQLWICIKCAKFVFIAIFPI